MDAENISMEGEIGGVGEPKDIVISLTELYIVMGILSFLSIMGTAGNALVLYVFAKKRDRLTSTLFILSLAFVDLVTCLVVVPYTMYMEYARFQVKYDVACKLYQFLITSNIPFSALVMVAIAIDRYFCICHPFMHAINIQRAKIMIAGLALFAVGLGVIVALMYGVYQNPQDQLQTNGTSLNGTALYNMSDSNGTEVKFIPIYTGHCQPTTLYLKREFQNYYQKAYTAMYLVCLIIVIILYVLIYNSVLTRRTKRQKQKSKSLPMVTSTQPDDNCNSQEETLLTTVNGDAQEVKNGKNVISPDAKSSTTHLSPTPTATATVSLTPSGPMTTVVRSKSKDKKKDDKERRKSTKKDRNRIANLKTAAMLFVVTVVFIVTFLPAFLMALELIPYNIIVFYMYFANNVANPVIYSFMNKNFRDDLKKLFCRR